jgi:non-homologous end joining protein Ku
MVCPDHKTFVHQELHCDESTNHEVARDTTLRGAITEDGMRVINPEETPRFEASSTFDLVPVPADDLDTHTARDKSVFYVLPKPKTGSEEAWLTFMELVRDKKTAYVINGSIRAGKKNLYRLTEFNGYLAIQQLKFPSAVREAPPTPETDATKATLKQFLAITKQLSEQQSVEWTKFDSVDEYEDKLKEFIDAGELVDAPEGAKKEKKNTGTKMSGKPEDMIAQLQQALEEGAA